MTPDQTMTGSCMCGAVRYTTSGDPFLVSHCHCQSCRKHNGAPVVTLAGFKVDQVVWSGAERKLYESSPGANRAFCSNCGTPLTWEGDGDELGLIVELHISTFDEPDALVPTGHAFYPERLQWLDTADGLPRYEGFVGYSDPLSHGPASDGLPSA